MIAKENNHNKAVICCFFFFVAPRTGEHSVYYKLTVLSPISVLLDAFLFKGRGDLCNELKGLFSSLISLCWVN